MSVPIMRFTFPAGRGSYDHLPWSNGFIEPDGTFVEAEYQAYAKTADPEKRQWVLEAKKPFGVDGAKQRGRAVPLRPDHDAVKFQVMAAFVGKKFRDHESLREQLVATGRVLMVEGNDWHDNVWGDCTCGNADGKHPRCLEPGLNWLGLILMTWREAYRAG